MLKASARQSARREVIRQLLPTEVSRVEQMPKVELHLHLEGSIRPATMLELAERHGVDLGAADEDELLERYEFEDFDQFAKLFMLGLSVLRTGEDFELVIGQLADELLSQNVLHAEITTTPWNHLHRGVAAADYTAALDAGRAAAAGRGLSINWVCDIPRGFEDPPYAETIGYVLGPETPKGLAAFGLGGTEVGHPCTDFDEPFERALAAGLRSNPHAGETDGPDSVRAALDGLKAERIGHGVRSIEDEALVAELAQRRVPLEVCPTSNVALGVVPDYQHHQLRQMLEAGLNVSVNSDDPAYFSTTLTEELLVAMAFAGCSAGDIARLQANAADAAFLSGDERRALRDRVEAG